MPAESTLLAHLTPILTDRVEDTAVEALGYILSKSPSSRSALNRVLRSAVADLNSIERVRTQVTGDTGARPDLVGFDEHDKERVLIEAKFWAGLTENQPNGYLKRLPTDGPSALLFVAPEARRDTLWAELQRRATAELNDSSEENGLRSAKVCGSQRFLMLTSWRSLLGQMANQSSEAGESSTQIDIRQLQGLTERMDEEAFLPLQSMELAPSFARRMLGLNRLIDDATQRGIRDKWISTKGLAVAAHTTGYGRWIRLYGETAWFGVNVWSWAQKAETPIWVEFSRKKMPDGESNIPVRLRVGVEYEAVLDEVVEELKNIGQRINPEYELSNG